MEGLARKRAGDGSVGADQPEIEAQLLRDGQSKRMPPSGYQDDLYAFLVGTAQGGQISPGDLKLGIEQGAVNVGGQQADGKCHHMQF